MCSPNCVDKTEKTNFNHGEKSSSALIEAAARYLFLVGLMHSCDVGQSVMHSYYAHVFTGAEKCHPG